MPDIANAGLLFALVNNYRDRLHYFVVFFRSDLVVPAEGREREVAMWSQEKSRWYFNVIASLLFYHSPQ